MWASVYGIDKEKAYCFLVVQAADHYAMCFLWPDAEGVVRPHVSMRMVFGGSPWPQRFERVSLIDCAWIQHLQAQFDAQHPFTREVEQWREQRRDLQRRGVLPSGIEQSLPSGLEPFIDDLNGRALMDEIPGPPHLHHISIGAQQTVAVGVSPASDSSRLAAHCRIAVQAERDLGWSIGDSKTMCGEGMVLLGAILDARARCVRCPEVKRRWMLHAVHVLREGLAASVSVDAEILERFTGRATNLSQFFPELRLPLAVGYALARVSWVSRRGVRRRPTRRIRLKPGGRRVEELYTLLRVVEDVIQDDRGVVLAPCRHFADFMSPGVLTMMTDASRAAHDDGVGGFAFLSSRPGICWIMSEPWPSLVKQALDFAALRRAQRASLPVDTPLLSMPAAELFGALGLAAAVLECLSAGTVVAVISVTDCQPAASAVNSWFGRSGQMRGLLRKMRDATSRWLGVHVSRDLNVDADRLSHPSLRASVMAESRARGLRSVPVSIPEGCWELLRAATRLEMASSDAEWASVEVVGGC